jgi:hypothetical protein
MKMTKLDGIQLLDKLKLPTVKLFKISDILNENVSIKNGISLRLSPTRCTSDRNVSLPSIHNCKDLEKIKQFIEQYKLYNIFSHYTVKPDVIGSMSKLNHTNSIILETFRDFDERKEEILKNRLTIPIEFDRIMISKLQMLKNDKNDFLNFKKVILYLKDIPFQQYDIEYVIEDGNVIFTDLTLPNEKEFHSYMEYFNDIDNKYYEKFR